MAYAGIEFTQIAIVHCHRCSETVETKILELEVEKVPGPVIPIVDIPDNWECHHDGYDDFYYYLCPSCEAHRRGH